MVKYWGHLLCWKITMLYSKYVSSTLCAFIFFLYFFLSRHFMTCSSFELAHSIRVLFTCSAVELIKESPDICTCQNALLHVAQAVVIYLFIDILYSVLPLLSNNTLQYSLWYYIEKNKRFKWIQKKKKKVWNRSVEQTKSVLALPDWRMAFGLLSPMANYRACYVFFSK